MEGGVGRKRDRKGGRKRKEGKGGKGREGWKEGKGEMEKGEIVREEGRRIDPE